MMGSVESMALLEHVIEAVIPIGAYILASVIKQGVDRSQLAELIKKVAAIELKQNTHSELLASHTELLKKYDGFSDQLTDLTKTTGNTNNLVRYIAGKLDIPVKD